MSATTWEFAAKQAARQILASYEKQRDVFVAARAQSGDHLAWIGIDVERLKEGLFDEGAALIEKRPYFVSIGVAVLAHLRGEFVVGMESHEQGVMDRYVEHICEVLAKKQHDYGHENIAAFGARGITVRLSDKLARLRNLERRHEVGLNEAIEDTWLDLFGYAVIGVMWEDETFGLPLADDLPQPMVVSAEAAATLPQYEGPALREFTRWNPITRQQERVENDTPLMWGAATEHEVDVPQVTCYDEQAEAAAWEFPAVAEAQTEHERQVSDNLAVFPYDFLIRRNGDIVENSERVKLAASMARHPSAMPVHNEPAAAYTLDDEHFVLRVIQDYCDGLEFEHQIRELVRDELGHAAEARRNAIRNGHGASYAPPVPSSERWGTAPDSAGEDIDPRRKAS